MQEKLLRNIPLGKNIGYHNQYDPSLLFKIERSLQRQKLINLRSFYGYDLWNCYELTWLNNKGKPQIAIMQFVIDANSRYIVESKSLKLYLGSFGGSKFDDINAVKKTISEDLSKLLDTDIFVKIFLPTHISLSQFNDSINIDNYDIECQDYQINKDLLSPDTSFAHNNKIAHEKIYSNLLKSNCLITNQPDYASIFIEYKGVKICHKSLLKYLISFRDHNEFHEQCVERIFCDISEKFSPEKLIVYAKYTRRGGIDINPFRSSDNGSYDISNIDFIRDVRQ